jgi:hypothetical protein
MSARVGLSFLALLSLACATLSHEPARLLEQGRNELKLRKFDAAYADLSAIRAKYPRSPEAADAFAPAAQAFHAMYAKSRYQTDSPWKTTETRFMFEWLATFFGGDEFPQVSFERLVQGMPYEFFEEYERFAATRPELARWRLEVTKDNGLIDTISAEPVRTSRRASSEE